MPFPWLAAATIGGSLLNSGTQAWGQGKAQEHDEALARQQREWNEKMWGKQNEYNLNHWHRVNEYNSPIQQMARLSEAGLNPHLLYGQGVSGATGQASNIGTADEVKGYDRAQSRNIMDGIDVFGDSLRNVALQAQVSNVEANTQKTYSAQKEIEQDIAKKSRDNRHGDALEQSMLIDAKAELAQKKDNRRFEKEYQQEQRRLYNRNAKRFSKEMAKLNADVGRINSEKDLVELKKKYQGMVNEMLEDGVNINDPMWQRQLQIWGPELLKLMKEMPSELGKVNLGITPFQ